MIDAFNNFIREEYSCDESISLLIESEKDYESYSDLCYFLNVSVNKGVAPALITEKLICKIVISHTGVIHFRICIWSDGYYEDDVTNFKNNFLNYCSYRNSIKIITNRS